MRISDLILFRDNEAIRRSGHMGHAMAELAPGKIIDFVSNVDYDRCEGHSGYGWMEYAVSEDGGDTWGDFRVLPYSKAVYDGGVHTALCEKAVVTGSGVLVCLFQITDASLPIACEPWSEPTFIRSFDGGETWTEAGQAAPEKGRIYDALARGREVWFLMEANEHFLGTKPEHRFQLYHSSDDGASFSLLSDLPLNAFGCGYGAMEFAANGDLICFVYDSNDETHMPYCVSGDGGRSWKACGKSYVAKKIRNPQVVRVGESWFLHGRNGGDGDGLVLYASRDGIVWDDGVTVASRPQGDHMGTGYYSNNLLVRGEKPRVLIQFSHVFDRNRVNIMHVWLDDTETI